MTAATSGRSQVVGGGHVLTMGPAGDLEDGAVAFADGEVVAVGAFAELATRAGLEDVSRLAAPRP